MKKNYYRVTFRWYDTETYCTNLCIAESEEEVEKKYSKYSNVTIKPAENWEIETAKMKGMPITEA